MRYPMRPLLLATLCLPLMSTACGTASTPRPTARTERPILPPLPSNLTKTERLEPLTAAPSGKRITVDQAVFLEIVTRFAEAIGAVERGNRRAVAVAQERECVRSILATGTVDPGCQPEVRGGRSGAPSGGR